MKKLFNEAGFYLTDKELNDFTEFKDLILEYNKVMDITNITEEDEISYKHFIDSLESKLAKVDFNNKKMIDVGTGGGFPGIPLKIMHQDLELTLLDSLNKRIRFLDVVIEKLNLSKTQAIHGRAEELARQKEFREQYDIVISRAVANLATLTEYCLAFIKPGGVFVSMKGPNYEEELAQARNAIDTMGGKLKEVIPYTLPDEQGERTLIVIEKTRPTPAKYPRGQGKPRNKPL